MAAFLVSSRTDVQTHGVLIYCTLCNGPAPVLRCGAAVFLALTPQVEQEPGHGHEQARDPQPGHPTPGLGLAVFRHRTHLQCQRRRTREAKSRGGAIGTCPDYTDSRADWLGDVLAPLAFHSESNRSPSPLQRWWASTLPQGRYPAVMRPMPPAYGDAATYPVPPLG
jgi:hypothetical protein